MKQISLLLSAALMIFGAHGLKGASGSGASSTNESRQILIEAVVFEIVGSHARELGLGPTGATPLGLNGKNIGPSDPMKGFGYVTKLSNEADSVTAALARDRRVKILQRPRIQTSHDVPATLFVGETLPAARRANADVPGAGSAVQTVPVGLTFGVTPLIGSEDRITLDLHFRIDRIEGHRMVDNVGEMPVISTREARAKVQLRDRDAILFGGLRSSGSRGKTSSLRSPKDLGALGTHARSMNVPSELLVIVRPTFIAR